MLHKKKMQSVWYDSHHQGALRILNEKDQKIIGSDPDLLFWEVPFVKCKKNVIRIDFHGKATHKANKVLYARRTPRKLFFYKTSALENPINIWHHVGHDPTILFDRIKNE